MPSKKLSRPGTNSTHNPTPEELDEPVTILVGLDPEEVLAAVLQVDPESEPASEEDRPSG